jgi:hypothetical protein
MTLLIDDQLLAAHLRGIPVLGHRSGPVFTTGLWYLRLCLALGRGMSGRLSGPFLSLSPARQRRALGAVLALPREIGLLSLRRLGPTIGELSDRHRPMNALTREALAAAVTLQADVLMAEHNQNHVLATAAAQEDLDVEFLVFGEP